MLNRDTHRTHSYVEYALLRSDHCKQIRVLHPRTEEVRRITLYIVALAIYEKTVTKYMFQSTFTIHINVMKPCILVQVIVKYVIRQNEKDEGKLDW